MYNSKLIDNLVSFIDSLNGVTNKRKLSDAVMEQFHLVKDRSVFYCKDFAIRFSQASKRNLSNGIVALSTLQKFDDRPFIVCIVTPEKNFLLLANTTMLSKISHSSQELRTDNIKGTFLGSDIYKTYENIENSPENFETLFNTHENFTFDENLSRLVEKTNGIRPTGKKFEPTDEQLRIIREAVPRAINFEHSPEYLDLESDLQQRINKVQNEIAIAAFIDNVNVRGRIIEYLITSDGDSLRSKIIDSLNNDKKLPTFKTKDELGDFYKEYEFYSTATEIKTKVLFLSSNPKAYNIDKLLTFLSEPKSIYMLYIVGIDDDGNIKTKLCSFLDQELLIGTKIMFQWAGRNSRGVTQFMGNALIDKLHSGKSNINQKSANSFLEKLIAL